MLTVFVRLSCHAELVNGFRMRTKFTNSMEETRSYLRSIGLPDGDAYDLITSENTFTDGGQYRFEVHGIWEPIVMKALLVAIDSYGLYLHRVT